MCSVSLERLAWDFKFGRGRALFLCKTWNLSAILDFGSVAGGGGNGGESRFYMLQRALTGTGRTKTNVRACAQGRGSKK